MQNVINTHDIIKELKSNGLQIGDKQLFYYYVKNFNYNTFIYGYSAPFYENERLRRYDPEAISDELINLYRFDRDMANHILRFILVIEKIINTNVAYEIINQHNIKDKCLLKLNQNYIEHQIIPNLQDVEPKINYFNFIHKLIKYLPTSLATKIYMRKKAGDDITRWRECPLDVMCLTWSFATSFSLFIALDYHIRAKILNNFGLYPSHLNGFIKIMKNILHLRNMISHNNVIYDAKMIYDGQDLFDVYEFIFHRKITSLRLIHVMELIEYFSHSKTLIANSRYYFNKLVINQKFKNRILLFADNE
ncbi:MAG: Abi family protein [Mycoplasmataceae bacterium]|nr:Abi family protein [Mycoplasmataceae bacterium]